MVIRFGSIALTLHRLELPVVLSRPIMFKRHRFLKVIILQVLNFKLSYRDVEAYNELLDNKRSYSERVRHFRALWIFLTSLFVRNDIIIARNVNRSPHRINILRILFNQRIDHECT